MASQPQNPRDREDRRAELLEALLRSKRTRLLRQAHLHSRRPADAEDALSDACVQFLRFYDGPTGSDALRWMLVVVKRCAWAISERQASRERRIVRDRQGGARDVAAIAKGEWGEPADLLARLEETERIIVVMEQLKPDERTALILLGLGCSHAEIGEIRGWSPRKVNRLLAEGRQKVRRLLEGGVDS